MYLENDIQFGALPNCINMRSQKKRKKKKTCLESKWAGLAEKLQGVTSEFSTWHEGEKPCGI